MCVIRWLDPPNIAYVPIPLLFFARTITFGMWTLDPSLLPATPISCAPTCLSCMSNDYASLTDHSAICFIQIRPPWAEKSPELWNPYIVLLNYRWTEMIQRRLFKWLRHLWSEHSPRHWIRYVQVSRSSRPALFVKKIRGRVGDTIVQVIFYPFLYISWIERFIMSLWKIALWNFRSAWDIESVLANSSRMASTESYSFEHRLFIGKTFIDGFRLERCFLWIRRFQQISNFLDSDWSLKIRFWQHFGRIGEKCSMCYSFIFRSNLMRFFARRWPLDTASSCSMCFCDISNDFLWNFGDPAESPWSLKSCWWVSCNMVK